MPKVSIIIPNFNHAPFLRQRVESVLQQSFQNFEIIILDDCSTDGSISIIEELSLGDQRIRFIPNLYNSGSPFIQWNKGVNMAVGEYIWIAESDDVADLTILEELVKRLDEHPSVGLAYCQSYRFDASGKVTGRWNKWTADLDENLFEADFVMGGQSYVEQFLIHRNTIPNASGVLFRKSAYEQVGGANGKIKNCSDWLTWLKMLMLYDVAYVAKPLNYFRYHSNSVIAKLHLNKSRPAYMQYDKTMRLAFDSFLNSNNFNTTKRKIDSISKFNKQYVYKEVGSEGIFLIESNSITRGWVRVLEASLKGSFNAGLLKRAIAATISS